MSPNARTIAEAVLQGPVRAIGGIVYNDGMKALMNTTSLHDAIKELDQEGIIVRRQDAGGSPRWELESCTPAKP